MAYRDDIVYFILHGMCDSQLEDFFTRFLIAVLAIIQLAADHYDADYVFFKYNTLMYISNGIISQE